MALFRPGPLQSGMVDNFIDRKHGREQVSYPDAQYQHPSLQPILEPTYGIILYQEQVMQIAQELAGYTLGGADLLRRAMGKKFAGYGFNKSHSAAYALVSYQTAWLKVHYPAEFMAAVMSSELDNTDKLITLRDECKHMGLVVRPPAVNEGQYAFSVNDDGEIIYGLGAIKGLGEGPVDNILSARAAGPFSDLFEFCDRTDPKKVNRRAIEALINSGALDELKAERWVMMSAVEDALRAAEQAASNTAAGMGDLFGTVLPAGSDADPYENHRATRPWSAKRLLNGEKESIGSFLSGHPMEEYETEVRKFASRRIRDLQVDNNATVAGLIVSVRTIRTQRGVLAVLGLIELQRILNLP